MKKIVVWRTGVNFLRLIGIEAQVCALPTHLAFTSVRLKDAKKLRLLCRLRNVRNNYQHLVVTAVNIIYISRSQLVVGLHRTCIAAHCHHDQQNLWKCKNAIAGHILDI